MALYACFKKYDFLTPEGIIYNTYTNKINMLECVYGLPVCER